MLRTRTTNLIAVGRLLLEPDDPVYAWRERLLQMYDGFAWKAKGYPVWA